MIRRCTGKKANNSEFQGRKRGESSLEHTHTRETRVERIVENMMERLINASLTVLSKLRKRNKEKKNTPNNNRLGFFLHRFIFFLYINTEPPR